MNSSGETSPSIELPPQPSPEVQPGQEQAVEAAPPARPETSGNWPQQPALPAVPDDIPAAEPPVIAAAPKDIQAPPARYEAKDIDNLEPVWKHQTDSAIAATKDDPHLRTIKLGDVKKEYQRSRFNHQLKADEEKAA